MFRYFYRCGDTRDRQTPKRILRIEQLESRQLLSASSMHDHSTVQVTETAIITQNDEVPRFVADPSDIAVQDGNWSDPRTWADGTVPTRDDLVRIDDEIQVQLDAFVEIDSLEILGQLRFANDRDTSLMVTTITVMPGGVLTLGTPDNPIADTVSAEIVFRDTPLQTGTADEPGIDPFQFGNGLIVFGELITEGMEKTPFVRATTDIMRGDSSIQLQSVPSDWQIGDTLLLPKSSQDPVLKRPRKIDETETVTISAIDGDTVWLTQPVQFDHRGVSDNPFGVSVFVHVANLTRNVTLRSENPEGTRGQVMITGQGIASIRNIQVQSLGRTRADVQLDSTVTDPETGQLYIGTNQIARYPIHLHHAENPSEIVGNVVQDNLRWGIVIHDTNNSLVQGNIVYDTDGSGVMVEKGTEVGNQFLDNLVVKVDGSQFTARGGVKRFQDQLGRLVVQTGTDGSGFWFRSGGSAGITEGNAVYDAAGYAYNFNGYYEGQFLGVVDSFSGNEAVSSKGGLWLTWSQGLVGIEQNYQPQVFEDLLVWHSQEGVHAFHEGFFTLRDVTVIGDAAASAANEGSATQITARSSIGILLANPSYENLDVTLEGIRVSGQNIGFSQPGSAGERGTVLRDAVFANYVNMLFLTSEDQAKLSEENVLFLPSKVTKIAASFPATVANRYVRDEETIEEVGELSDTLPPPITLPASIQIRDGVLRIDGSAGDDEIILSQEGDQLTITSQGQSSTIERSLVSSYLLRAGDGDDYFENQTSINGLILGGSGDDTLIGGSGNDSIVGGSGNDILNGNGGDDIIYGGDGDDTILGGSGEDKIRAGGGDDNVDGGDGNDPVIDGGTGNDILRGGSGNDILVGDAGDDQLFGQNGNDSLGGGPGNDLLHGGDDDDVLSGGEGDDMIFGGNGADKIRAGNGNDIVDGGAGNDPIIDGGGGDDTLRGGAGNDLILGGTGDDEIFGDTGDDRLYGGSGNDRIRGGEGNDDVFGGADNDIVYGDSGQDKVQGGTGIDTVFIDAFDLIFGDEEDTIFLI